jgi:hypothetical protein
MVRSALSVACNDRRLVACDAIGLFTLDILLPHGHSMSFGPQVLGAISVYGIGRLQHNELLI